MNREIRLQSPNSDNTLALEREGRNGGREREKAGRGGEEGGEERKRERERGGGIDMATRCHCC